MSPSHTTNLAAAIVAPVGVTCRYEFQSGRFSWTFWRGSKILATVVEPAAVIKRAEKILSMPRK